MQETLFGIDLGGTKVECAVLPADHLTQPLSRCRRPTESPSGYEHILDQIVGVVEEAIQQSGASRPERVGLGTPGITDPDTGLMRGSNTQCLNGRPLVADLASRLGIEVVTANDANCFALAEATLGCAAGYPTVFGVILGTGVGGGIVMNGQVIGGRHDIAGEWGQIVIDPSQPPSPHGAHGTVEALIAGPALEAFYMSKTGQALALKEIATRAERAADPAAVETIERLIHYFAESIAVVINVLDPHAIVLGGGVGNIEALYGPATHERIVNKIFNDEFRAALLKPALGDSAGVFGAAMLLQ